jgi:hypothetical protein
MGTIGSRIDRLEKAAGLGNRCPDCPAMFTCNVYHTPDGIPVFDPEPPRCPSCGRLAEVIAVVLEVVPPPDVLARYEAEMAAFRALPPEEQLRRHKEALGL